MQDGYNIFFQSPRAPILIVVPLQEIAPTKSAGVKDTSAFLAVSDLPPAALTATAEPILPDASVIVKAHKLVTRHTFVEWSPFVAMSFA